MARAVELCEEDAIDYQVWVNEMFPRALLLYVAAQLTRAFAGKPCAKDRRG